MSLALALALALLLDAWLGEPSRLYDRVPHPVSVMGSAISWMEERFNHGSSRWLKGVMALAALVAAAFVIAVTLSALPDFRLLEIAIAAMLLAHKSLIEHVRAVADALQDGLEPGRHAVAQIVGRDVGSLDESGVARASIESAAENFSDGVVAPAFWFLFFGLPGIVIYKLVNTADSMIGYRTERYEEFGWAAAKLDDVLNWIPARLTGVLICAVYRSRKAFEVMREDAPLHRSPNAGWPEAAMAGVAGVALAGPRMYFGEMTNDLYVNPHGTRQLDSLHILEAITVLRRTWSAMVIGLIVLAVLDLLLF